MYSKADVVASEFVVEILKGFRQTRLGSYEAKIIFSGAALV